MFHRTVEKAMACKACNKKPRDGPYGVCTECAKNVPACTGCGGIDAIVLPLGGTSDWKLHKHQLRCVACTNAQLEHYCGNTTPCVCLGTPEDSKEFGLDECRHDPKGCCHASWVANANCHGGFFGPFNLYCNRVPDPSSMHFDETVPRYCSAHLPKQDDVA